MTQAILTEAPPLENGDRMDRYEFHRRVMLRPELERAELIEGIVYLPTAINFAMHGRPQTLILAWLLRYEERHPGDVEVTAPVSVFLDDHNQPQPDALLFRKGAIERSDGYVEGAPDLVVEIANSSVSRDLHQKKEAYRRNGVPEYIVWRVGDGANDWFELVDEDYVLRERDAAGFIESAHFPGLRLHVPSALSMDRRGVLAGLER